MKKFHRQISGRLNIIMILLSLTLMLSSSLSAMDNRPSIDQSLLKGKDLFDNGKYESALKYFLNLSKNYPDNGYVFYEIANTYYALKDYSRALTFAKKAETLLPPTDRIKTLLGNIYAELNRPDEAVKHFMAAAKLNPQSASAFFNLGVFFYNNRNYSEAESALETSLNINPENPSARFALGCVYARMNMSESAEASFRLFLDMEKDSGRSETARNILKTIILEKPKS